MSASLFAVLLLLQEVPPSALVLAMALAYALGFLGMLLAWKNYRKRVTGKLPPSPPSGQSPREEKRNP
jgi:hypothetical protein